MDSDFFVSIEFKLFLKNVCCDRAINFCVFFFQKILKLRKIYVCFYLIHPKNVSSFSPLKPWERGNLSIVRMQQLSPENVASSPLQIQEFASSFTYPNSANGSLKDLSHIF